MFKLTKREKKALRDSDSTAQIDREHCAATTAIEDFSLRAPSKKTLASAACE